MSRSSALALVTVGLALAGGARAEIVRVGPASSTIANAVTVPARADMIYVSGITPQPADPAKPAELGDTRTQTQSILNQISDILKERGFAMADVVMMRVYLVGDPAQGGKMDFAGMRAAYAEFFGTAAQPNKPARVTVQVAALAAPAMLAEIEVQAAKEPSVPRR